ncbi:MULTISPECIES: hypothetical protein [Pseudomonas]|uniref:Uncharacterized protein n=1 Tax=Pseudomonas asiatica TaxID=2219225 RepID=A0ABU5L4C9_9PSED|nr:MULTISPECIES: hypothetical protein [Pseudomonas]MDZ5741009.1 hypothetical protein [Pseudomonas asiatica]MDZ5745910.1 hypothetical protein [Pseudomonas asiatica]MDZ5750536.1 hypothetical protein [Pseudomonas asiatica]MDZ5756418.1 hypothetical protein [Pseudomonas asiatica]
MPDVYPPLDHHPATPFQPLLACTLLPPGLLTADITTAAAQQPQPAATAADDFNPLNNLPQEAPQTFT